MARIQTVTSYQRHPLEGNWELLAAAPGSYTTPGQLDELASLIWQPALVPGTVIGALQKNQRKRQWDLEQPVAVEAQDWWYRSSFELSPGESDRQMILHCSGLATVVDVWLNGKHILHADNMFRTYEIDITALLTEQNTLVLRFFSMQTCLAEKKPRPRWRPQLMDHQQLRWWRTTLLGHIPGWSPPVQTIGPWRPLYIEERTRFSLEHVHLQATLQDDQSGLIAVDVRAHTIAAALPISSTLIVADEEFSLALQPDTQGFALQDNILLEHVESWWPHTHGAQPLYPVSIRLFYADESTVIIDCGRLAFRRIELIRGPSDDDFGFCVNGVDVFSRGACWTPLDIVTLSATPEAYISALKLAQQAGMNMLRVSGTMVYETDLFYDLCDELGLLIWQDFMFANMDYPFSNAAFLENVEQECVQLLDRLQTHPCLALLCGNSEIQQQVHMLGLGPELAQIDYFDRQLPLLCQAFVDLPYWSSTPGGGALPFQANVGNSHYQGVGAYLRPLEDARRSEVRFVTECLSFSNIPEDQTIDLILRAGESVYHHPKWKARVPRDAAAGWDFEDIRDFYLMALFAADTLKLRYTDMERYLALSRVVPGEVMFSVYAEWRRPRSTCHGGLIWFYRDLWPGAGWGVVDATGYPKAAYYYLKRILAPTTCFFSDEGVSGLWLHVLNDAPSTRAVALRVAIYRHSSILVESVTEELELAPHAGRELHIDALFQHFLDLTYAYRFGPPGHDLVVATLVARQTQELLGEAYYFPQGLTTTRATDIGLHAQVETRPDGSYALTLHTQQFAHVVAIHAEKFLPDDNYFSLSPASERTILLHPLGQARAFQCTISALNTYNEITLSS
jgi:beta-mannosidase